jgi:hypothetical protein
MFTLDDLPIHMSSNVFISTCSRDDLDSSADVSSVDLARSN